jgi:hypothetical protein
MTRDAEIAARFARDTAKHTMTVLLDQGLHRHVKFAQPDGNGYWFELVTWPCKLTVNGSVGTYIFSVSPTEDMFDFFRRSRWSGGPNPTYWDEKVIASREDVIQFSNALFDKAVAEELAEGEKVWPGVTADWKERTEGWCAEWETLSEYGARLAVRDFSYLPEDATGEPFSFSDATEWKLRDYDWKYLCSCHAIVWGIAQYDAARKAVAA